MESSEGDPIPSDDHDECEDKGEDEGEDEDSGGVSVLVWGAPSCSTACGSSRCGVLCTYGAAGMLQGQVRTASLTGLEACHAKHSYVCPVQGAV